ncbi:BRO1-domain-containing protein [Microthyrium microscopicum]|uniref:BRO1-domain-containing protein n=1 Tax=Microthyrium microscopicum TaxID=703497 RepID=A0A6A6UPL5_9PEZI|nr:BRO1-domain-containing protein [Microthyrium microscopicum]
MASNMLTLPFRRSPIISLSDALKQYISKRYDQHPGAFAEDLEAIDKLRTAAVQSVDPHASAIKKLQAYAAQLVWMSGKFPIDIGVEFPWYPAIGYNKTRPETSTNLHFELINVLFNLAAMYSQLALGSRSTPDALKTACSHYCQAAGILHHLSSSAIPDMRAPPPEDMDVVTLECLEQLMLAQAQECVWQKAVKDGMKDMSIARIAAKVSDYYAAAAEFGAKSDVVESEWIHHMKAKHYHFAAATQYRAACDCLDKRRYGEEVARLKDGLSCVTEALKESRYINQTVLADLQALKERTQEDLKRAEKDNDMIYLMPVPTKGELKTIEPISMASAKVPPEVADPVSMLGENGQLGRPLFTKLVPYAVHQAALNYGERKDGVVNQTIEELEGLTNKLHDLLKSLNLPGALQAIEKPLGLPAGLIQHAEEIRQQDGPSRLQRSIQETERVKSNDRGIFQEGRDMLRMEASEDERLRRKHGTDRWSIPPPQQAAPKLYAQVQEIDGYLGHSHESDEVVLKKLAESESLILLLAGRDRDLEQFVPSSRRAAMTPALESAANKLRACLNDVTRIEARRKRKLEALFTKVKQDDIEPELVREAARLEREFPMQKVDISQFQKLFEKRLEIYTSDKDMGPEETDQARLSQKLQDANNAFVQARKGDTSTKEREKALQSLENAYFKYKEIISNLEAGRKFYNDLAKVVSKFRDDCRTFVLQRRADATQQEAELVSGMSAMNFNTAASLHQQKQTESRNSPALPLASPANNAPLAAPQPTRAASHASGMWAPDMGIRFGGAPGGPEGGGEKGWNPAKGMKFS